jgi:hypothetical protein
MEVLVIFVTIREFLLLLKFLRCCNYVVILLEN